MGTTFTKFLHKDITVPLLHARHLVVTDCVQLVVCYRGGLRAEFVKTDRLVGIFQRYNVNRISCVVYKHLGVTADFHKVDYIVFYILVIIAYALQPAP